MALPAELSLVNSRAAASQMVRVRSQLLDRLALIALGRAAGFSLDEIARMFASDCRPRIVRAMLAAKAVDLYAKILKLTAMREVL